MALIKYSRPNTDVFSRTFNDIVDEFFNVQNNNYKTDRFMPSINIAETDTQFEISAELPGVKKENIKVDLEKGRLTISGERLMEEKEEGKNYHRIETNYGMFTRALHLPEGIDEESIIAKYEDGVLDITINKSPEKARKQIEIS
ncbi:MAG: Hsp20/alpha crystallin family protein [Balneolaceae bacterium]